jgi:hypothetical protein
LEFDVSLLAEFCGCLQTRLGHIREGPTSFFTLEVFTKQFVETVVWTFLNVKHPRGGTDDNEDQRNGRNMLLWFACETDGSPRCHLQKTIKSQLLLATRVAHDASHGRMSFRFAGLTLVQLTEAIIKSPVLASKLFAEHCSM